MPGSPEQRPARPDPLEGPESGPRSESPEQADYSTPPETATNFDSWGSGDAGAAIEDRSDRSSLPEDDAVLFGKYRVVRELGAGGLGRVYLVRHLKLDTDRALKTILPVVAGNPIWRQRFGREAKAMARLSHPHIVVVHDADVMPDGQAFIEMEYIRGQSLEKRIIPGEAVPLDEVDRLLGPLAEALQFAHDQGIVHRDLKPGNLMLQEGPSPGLEILKVLDFGIAKILHSEDPDDKVTQIGEPIGTPSYMSPEQIRGTYANEGREGPLDARSDIYSVGVILYQLLTGSLPFVGGRMMVLLGHLNEAIPSFAERNPEARIPIEIEALVLRSLDKDPRRRPDSMRELAQEFHRLVQASRDPAEVLEDTWSPGPRKPGVRRAGTRLPLLVAFAVVLMFGLGLIAWRLAYRTWSVTVEDPDVEVTAGEERVVILRLEGRDPSLPVEVAGSVIPEGVATSKAASLGVNSIQIKVSADLNARPVASYPLELEVRSGKNRGNASIRMTIKPPKSARVPEGFARAEGSRWIMLVGGKVYPDRIVRRIDDRLAPEFILIPIRIGAQGPSSSFYIMKDKVSNALFDAYLDSINDRDLHLKTLEKLRPPERLGREDDPRWPAFGVSIPEARKFAAWLVPEDHGLKADLPTTQQWDKAAGAFDVDIDDRKTHDGRGPFLLNPSGSTQDGIAVNREEPMPVGTAHLDVSRFGCRDMAGNGTEWTRPEADPTKRVSLRGEKYEKRIDGDSNTPYFFKNSKIQRQEGTSPSWGNGFRLVIDNLEQAGPP
jgi:serine/threonine protein kinase